MKNKDDIYEAFLNAIDEDLRSMCKKNVKAEKPFPYRLIFNLSATA